MLCYFHTEYNKKKIFGILTRLTNIWVSKQGKSIRYMTVLYSLYVCNKAEYILPDPETLFKGRQIIIKFPGRVGVYEKNA